MVCCWFVSASPQPRRYHIPTCLGHHPKYWYSFLISVANLYLYEVLYSASIKREAVRFPSAPVVGTAPGNAAVITKARPTPLAAPTNPCSHWPATMASWSTIIATICLIWYCLLWAFGFVGWRFAYVHTSSPPPDWPFTETGFLFLVVNGMAFGQDHLYLQRPQKQFRESLSCVR